MNSMTNVSDNNFENLTSYDYELSQILESIEWINSRKHEDQTYNPYSPFPTESFDIAGVIANETLIQENLNSFDDTTIILSQNYFASNMTSLKLLNNITSLWTEYQFEDILLTFILSLIIIAIIAGNTLVMVSVICFRKMRTLSNGLIASLASADLLVAVLVLPISLLHELVGPFWTLGPHICDLWITSDVFCCTASILNIVVIALDRYWLITKNVRYTHNSYLPRRKVCAILLFFAWILAALISALPLLGWRTGKEKIDPTLCVISQDYAFTIFSTFGAFWFPLILIIVVYFKIFFFARRRAIRRNKNSRSLSFGGETTRGYRSVFDRSGSTAIGEQMTQCVSPPPTPINQIPFTTEIARSVCPVIFLQPPMPTRDGRLRSSSSRSGTRSEREKSDSDASPPEVTTVITFPIPQIRGDDIKLPQSRKYRSRRMRRSARMLGLIIGGFIICWMPFFIVATVAPFCEEACKMPRVVASLVTWLGYSNSLFNPAIYAIWDKSFRRSFKRLCTCDLSSRW